MGSASRLASSSLSAKTLVKKSKRGCEVLGYRATGLLCHENPPLLPKCHAYRKQRGRIWPREPEAHRPASPPSSAPWWCLNICRPIKQQAPILSATMLPSRGASAGSAYGQPRQLRGRRRAVERAGTRRHGFWRHYRQIGRRLGALEQKEVSALVGGHRVVWYSSSCWRRHVVVHGL